MQGDFSQFNYPTFPVGEEGKQEDQNSQNPYFFFNGQFPQFPFNSQFFPNQTEVQQQTQETIAPPVSMSTRSSELNLKDPNILRERLKQEINNFSSIIFKTYQNNPLTIILVFQNISLYIEGLIAYNLFENIMYYLLKDKTKQEIDLLLSPIKAIATENKPKGSRSGSSRMSQSQSQDQGINEESPFGCSILLPPILQLIIGSQFFFNSTNQLKSFLKCLKLYSKHLFSDKQAVDWLSALLPSFAKFFYFALVDEDRKQLDPYNLYQIIETMNEDIKGLAFSPEILKCFQKYEKDPSESIYDDIILAANSPYSNRMDQMKLEISQMKSITYFLAYIENVHYLVNKTVTKSMEGAIKALYGQPINDKLYGTKIFSDRCKEIGKIENQKYHELIDAFLSSVPSSSADYRTVYIKKFNNHSIERDLFYSGTTLISLNKDSLDKTFHILKQLSETVPEIQESFSDFSTLLDIDISFYCTVKYAVSFIHLQEACRICENESDESLQNITNAILHNSPPYISFGTTELSNVDVPFRGIMKGLKHWQEKDSKYGAICKKSNTFYIVYITVLRSNLIELTPIQNIAQPQIQNPPNE